MKKKLVSVLLAAVMAVSMFTLPAIAADIRYGDLDGDGDITPNDALLVLRAGVGLETYTGDLFTAADVDGDGSLTPIDALQILRYSVGLITLFPAEGGTDTSVDPDLETLFRLVNEARAAEGVAPLVYRADLQEVADIRAEEIRTLFDHMRPDGRGFYTVLWDLGLEDGIYYMGENIAYGYTTPEWVMEAWMDSPGHRENILDAEFRGIVLARNGNYWEQFFVD